MNTILVVEDQKLIRTMICDILEEHNYHTIEAEDGLEGLNLVENEKIALIITDLVMPNYDGVNFLSLITSCHPEIEVISMTSLPKEHNIYKNAAKIIGEDKIIPKTDSFDELINRVKSVLG